MIKVVCINSVSSGINALTEGEIYYKGESLGDVEMCHIHRLNGEFMDSFYESRFISLAEHRETQLNIILND